MEIYNNAMAQLDRFINEPGPVEKYLAIIEEKTKVKRTYIARGKYNCFFFFLFQFIIIISLYNLNNIQIMYYYHYLL